MKYGQTRLQKVQSRSRAFGPRLSSFWSRHAILALCNGGLLVAITVGAATTGLNPYSGIVERNTFGLKPPVNPADLVKPPPPVVADIKLQGITTILGRKQVLMKIKMPARPPEPAKEQSFVFVEGQREGDVEVKEIDPVEGTVKIDNSGTIVSLNMKDHGEKPIPGAVAPAISASLPGGAVPPPAPMVPTAAANSAAAPAVEGFGGNKTIPTRAVRTGVDGGGVSPLGSTTPTVTPSAASQRSIEENVAIYEVNRAKNEALIKAGAKIPRMPIHSLLKQSQPQEPAPSQ